MSVHPRPRPFAVDRGGVRLAGEELGDGTAVVLLHGLTATRRYVVMGSRYLPKHGYRLITYDARGHGESSPAPDAQAYRYSDLVADLEAVLDHAGLERAVLAGASMGAHTALAFALERPERVAALVQITPAYDGRPHFDQRDLAEWDALADGLETGGVEGFIDAWQPQVSERFREQALLVTRQRLERHRHPEAVAAALRAVPRSAAFRGLEQLERVEAPTLVVGSRDEADPTHRLKIAEQYVARLPHSVLLVEDEGKSPLAWQGARLSHAIDDFLQRVL